MIIQGRCLRRELETVSEPRRPVVAHDRSTRVGSRSNGQAATRRAQATVLAQTFQASDAASLAPAINAADNATGPVTMDITSSITLSQALPLLTATHGVTILGNGHTISEADSYRIFFIDARNRTGAIQVLALNQALAKGGDGGNGEFPGGGGAGLGGALFVNSGAVTLTGVTFANDAAAGGNGTVSPFRATVFTWYLAAPLSQPEGTSHLREHPGMRTDDRGDSP